MTLAGRVRESNFVSLSDGSYRSETDPFEGLSLDQQKKFSRYLSVRREKEHWSVRRKVRYAGLVQVGNLSYWLEPPFSPAAFVYLLLRRSGAPLAAERAFTAASNRRDRSLRELMRVLALTMVTEAERLAQGHIAQAYVTKTERLGVVRGRPLWHRQVARPSDGRVACRFVEKSTDSLENRLVLAGLKAAARWLDGSTDRTPWRTQAYLWQSLAEVTIPSPSDFDLAATRLNRLTDGYRPALALARALLFGFDLSSSDPNTQLYAPVFDLADLFETLVLLVSETAVTGTDLTVSAQTSERRAVVTQSGSLYRRIRPDLLFSRSGKPTLVLDSKFKPRYSSGGPTPTASHRISREDIFQTFFYAVRIAQRNGLETPLPSAIAAPLLVGSEAPSSEYRRVVWGEDLRDVSTTLTLLLIPVDDAVGAVRSSDIPYCRGLFAETPLF